MEEERAEFSIEKTKNIIKQVEEDTFKQQIGLVRNIAQKLGSIEEKNNCMKVRFLDWLSSKLKAWAEKLDDYSYSITTPCAVKLPEKKADTKWYSGFTRANRKGTTTESGEQMQSIVERLSKMEK